jgi:hypothetical protein
MNSSRLGLVVGVLWACVPAVACHGSAKPAASPGSGEDTESSSAEDDGGTASAKEGDGGAATAPPEPLAAVLLTDSAAVQKLYDAANAAPPATLKPDGATGKGPLAKGVRAIAKKAAPGMLPDGPMGTGTLKEKQHLQMEVTLQPGKCYALIGYCPKSKDLDLYLLTRPGILSGQDTTDDNKPVVGRAPEAMCPAASRAVTYTVDIFADKGGGELAVQLYSRDKGDK